MLYYKKQTKNLHCTLNRKESCDLIVDPLELQTIITKCRNMHCNNTQTFVIILFFHIDYYVSDVTNLNRNLKLIIIMKTYYAPVSIKKMLMSQPHNNAKQD